MPGNCYKVNMLLKSEKNEVKEQSGWSNLLLEEKGISFPKQRSYSKHAMKKSCLKVPQNMQSQILEEIHLLITYWCIHMVLNIHYHMCFKSNGILLSHK